MLLVGVAQLLRLRPVGAHAAQSAGELLDRLTNRIVVKVAQDLVTVIHRISVMERRTQERHQVVLLVVDRQRGDDLVEIQIAKEAGLGRAVDINVRTRSVEQDALKPLHDALPPGSTPVEAISRGAPVWRASSPSPRYHSAFGWRRDCIVRHHLIAGAPTPRLCGQRAGTPGLWFLGAERGGPPSALAGGVIRVQSGDTPWSVRASGDLGRDN